MKKQPFFKSKQLSEAEYHDIANDLKLIKVKAMKNIITLGDDGDKFYILIKGAASV